MQVTAIDQSEIYEDIYWTDGTIIHEGYMYSMNYDSDTGVNLLKIKLDDFTDVLLRDMSGDVEFRIRYVLGITICDGYLYFADSFIGLPVEFQPHLCKVDIDTLEIIDSWEIFAPLIEGLNGGDAVCSDDTCIYIGGRAKDVVRFHTGTEAITTCSIANQDFHSIGVDDDYVWAKSNTDRKLYKIDKSDMTVSDSVELSSDQQSTDDLDQDDDYVYVPEEVAGTAPYGIHRIKKSDMSVDTIFPTSDTLEGYGAILVHGNRLYVPTFENADDGKYYVRRINLDGFTLLDTIYLLGMAEEPAKMISDIFIEGGFVYVTLCQGEPYGFQVFKFELFPKFVFSKLTINTNKYNINMNTSASAKLIMT